MSGVAVAGLAVGMYGANQQANAAQDAANAQMGYGNLSLAEMKRQFDLQQNNLAPWLRAGREGLSEMRALMGLGGDTEAANRALFESPDYRFAVEQGNRGLAGSTAARGGMGSGKAMNAATTFGQNLATGTRANRLSQLAGLSEMGQNTATTMGQFGQNYAQGMGDIWQGMGNAQGAAGIAGANARQSGLLGGAQLGLNMYDYFNRPGWGQPTTGQQWATSNNPNYSGPGLAWPY